MLNGHNSPRVFLQVQVRSCGRVVGQLLRFGRPSYDGLATRPPCILLKKILPPYLQERSR